MQLLIDVGNTNIVAGVGRLGPPEVVSSWRLAASPNRTEDEYWITIRSLLRNCPELDFPGGLEGAVISSVVPNLTPQFASICRRLAGVEPLIIGPGVSTGLDIAYHDPAEVGADRIVNSVAAIELVGPPVIVVDFGTAITFDVVTPPNVYQGGAIAPGVSISLQALTTRTAKLPRTELARPERVVGKSPAESIQSGTFWGYLSLVEGMAERIRAETGTDAALISTGGMGGHFTEQADVIQSYHPDLTMQGLLHLAARN